MTTDDNVTFAVFIRKVKRLNRRVRLLERQNEIILDVLYDLLRADTSRTLLEHARVMQEIGRRHDADENEKDEENGHES